ncbi:MAG: GNAT family N-acetyltransferase [Dehalococcoidia bacterium]
MAALLEGFVLRTYAPGDRTALHEIDFEFQREVGFDTPERPRHHHDDMDDIEGVYLNAGGEFWVLERDAKVVAYGGVLRIDDTTARLRRFRVRSDWRRHGLATVLLEEAERFCRERGYNRVTLDTTDLQEPAQALYRKHGYVEVAERWLDHWLRQIEFEKVLS